jgi:hypothetical protein
MIMSKNIRRKKIKETDKYIARLEEAKIDGKNILFIHIELKGGVDIPLIKELRVEFEDYKRRVKLAGYDNIYSYSATPKFYGMFKGYEDLGPMVWDEKEYRVLRWALK